MARSKMEQAKWECDMAQSIIAEERQHVSTVTPWWISQVAEWNRHDAVKDIVDALKAEHPANRRSVVSRIEEALEQIED